MHNYISHINCPPPHRDYTPVVTYAQREARSREREASRRKTGVCFRNSGRFTADGNADRSEENLEEVLAELQEELKATKRRIAGLQNQIELTINKRNIIIRVNRVAKLALEVFDDILNKDKLDRNDLQLIIDKIIVYEDHVDIRLKADIDSLLHCGILPEEEIAANFDQGMENSLKVTVVQDAKQHPDKVFHVNVISDGDPLADNIDRRLSFRKCNKGYCGKVTY